MSIPKIRALHSAIEKSLFRIDGRWDYYQITNAIDLMARLILAYSDETDEVWAIGSYTECSLDCLIIAAYWHYSHWHDGMCSDEYMALDALGRLYSPGMTSEPQRDDPEWDCYDQLNRMAKRHHGKPVYDFVPITI